jgi:hypothetical protein
MMRPALQASVTKDKPLEHERIASLIIHARGPPDEIAKAKRILETTAAVQVTGHQV